MQSYKDNYSIYDENSIFELVVFSTIGDRDEQQDSAGYELKTDGGLVVVCDGMGGHEGGQLASSRSVASMLDIYNSDYPCRNVHDMLVNAAYDIDENIAMLRKNDGSKMKAGSTIAAVVIQNKSLHWLSVGDSRIYIQQNDSLRRITTDHIYMVQLNQQLKSGDIDREYYDKERVNGNSLISFMGAGRLPMIDCNSEIYEVSSGEKILIMSDGLYKLMTDDEINSLLSNFTNIKEAIQAIESKARRISKKTRANRDNMTLALIKIK